MKLNHTSIALTIGALFAVPIACAEDNSTPLIFKTYSETTTVSLENTVSVDISKKISVDKSAVIRVVGDINVPASGIAVIDDKQISHDNAVENLESLNTATVDGTAGQGAAGNVNFNVTAGDYNQQSNSTALAAVDASTVFGPIPIPGPFPSTQRGGMADAEIFINQDTTRNETYNSANINVALLGGGALSQAAGNIGVNISAGNNLLQKNDLAASEAKNGVVSEATIAVLQQTSFNWTRNRPDGRGDPNRASIGGFALAGAAGNIGVNVAAGTNNLQANSTAIAVNN